MTGKIKVLIVDDHAILRLGLSSLLKTKKDIEVAGVAEDGKTAITLTAKCKPDVVIMDLMMPGMSGIEATGLITKSAPKSKVLILTSFSASDGITKAIKAGATGAILKSTPFPDLVEAIRTVATGGKYIAPEIQRIMADDPPLPALSPRQMEILESMVRGLSSRDIATQLGISHDMVREHSTQLFAKLGAANRTEAVAIALRKHLLKI